MRYPKEWPGFRNKEPGWLANEGAIVEAVEIDISGIGQCLPPGFIGARIISGDTGEGKTHPVDGWHAAILHVNDLEPLTPAARAWKRERSAS